jgi:hypothetical protein
MSDPIAQAAQQISEQQPKEGIAGEIMGAMHALEEKVEHFLHPDAPAVAQPGESAASTSQPAADTTAKSSEQRGTTAPLDGSMPSNTPHPSNTTIESGSASAGSSVSGEQGNVAPAADTSTQQDSSLQPGATSASQQAPASSTQSSSGSPTEHPHTSCLRKIVACLRRDFAMLPGELEAWVKTAESHL